MNDAVFGQVRLRQMDLNIWTKNSIPFDAFLFVAGWESRASHVATSVRISSAKSYLLRFDSTDRNLDTRKSATGDQIIAAAAAKTIRLKRTADYLHNCDRLTKELNQLYRRTDRPLRIGLDISCLPKMYIAYLIALLFDRGICCNLTCFYSEGRYEVNEGQKKLVNKFHFSAGDWEPVSVPFLEGDLLSGHERNLLINLGAEVRQARAHAARFEPIETAIIGVNNSTFRLNLKTVPDAAGMSEYFDFVRGRGGPVASFELQDIISVAKKASEMIDGFKCGKTRIFAVGCKPHAVALSVLALAKQNVELVCRLPGAYANYDAVAHGPIWVFQLLNRFEPFAFIKG